MSDLANQLLDNLTEEELAALSANNPEEEHIVIGLDRYITVPDALKRIAVQHDHNIETVTFDCPRYWDNHDMSKMVIYINYQLPDETIGTYRATNVVVDEVDDKIMHFDWTIRREVTKNPGKIKFLVCICKTDAEGNEANHFNTEKYEEMYISEGLESRAAVVDEYPDIITQLIMLCEEAKAAVAAGAGVKNIEQTLKSDEENGQNTLKITLTDDRVMEFQIMNGGTPKRGVDYWTSEDKQEVINSVLEELPRAEDISV